MRRDDRKRTSTRVPGSPKRLSTAYAAEQRDQMQRGLRILARRSSAPTCGGRHLGRGRRHQSCQLTTAPMTDRR